MNCDKVSKSHSTGHFDESHTKNHCPIRPLPKHPNLSNLIVHVCFKNDVSPGKPKWFCWPNNLLSVVVPHTSNYGGCSRHVALNVSPWNQKPGNKKTRYQNPCQASKATPNQLQVLRSCKHFHANHSSNIGALHVLGCDTVWFEHWMSFMSHSDCIRGFTSLHSSRAVNDMPSNFQVQMASFLKRHNELVHRHWPNIHKALRALLLHHHLG